MERRRRGIVRAGVFPREWWYDLSEVVGAAPWLDALGTELYIPSQASVAIVETPIGLTLVPREKIITASWQQGSAKQKPQLEQVEGVRPHPTRRTRTFRIEAGVAVQACEPLGVVECDDQEDEVPDKEASQALALRTLYSSVFVPGVDERGQCQLRFDRQYDGSIRVRLTSLENRRS